MHAEPIAGLPVYRSKSKLHTDDSDIHANHGNDAKHSRNQLRGRRSGSGSSRGATSRTIHVSNADIHVADLADQTDVADLANMANVAHISDAHGNAHHFPADVILSGRPGTAQCRAARSSLEFGEKINNVPDSLQSSALSALQGSD